MGNTAKTATSENCLKRYVVDFTNSILQPSLCRHIKLCAFQSPAKRAAIVLLDFAGSFAVSATPTLASRTHRTFPDRAHARAVLAGLVFSVLTVKLSLAHQTSQSLCLPLVGF